MAVHGWKSMFERGTEDGLDPQAHAAGYAYSVSDIEWMIARTPLGKGVIKVKSVGCRSGR